jgi:hypothetical protein
MNSQFEREEDLLCEQYNSGLISQAEYNNEMRELNRDYRAQAQMAAEEAYENEMQRW